MKKVAFTLGLLCCLVIAGKAQQKKADSTKKVDPNAPIMVFKHKTHDYGTIMQDDNGTYLFKFTNEGKEPLVISHARGSCGCTVPQWPKDPINPGQSGVIKVTYDTHRIGVFWKTVTLNSNARQGQMVLTIKGKVLPKPKVEPFPGNGKTNEAPYDNSGANQNQF